MSTFKEYLSEAVLKAGFAPWHERDVQKIHQLLYHEIGAHKTHWNITNSDYKINKAGTVTFNNDYLNGAILAGISKIPDGIGFKYKYSTAKSAGLKIKSDKITNLWGAPDTVNGTLTIESHSIKTFDHLITKCSEYFIIDCPHLDSWGDCLVKSQYLTLKSIGTLGFKELYKHFEPELQIFIDVRVFENLEQKGVLGLLRMKPSLHGGRVQIRTRNNWENDSNIGKMLKIVSDNEDIMDCQEELIQQGYKEYARF